MVIDRKQGFYLWINPEKEFFFETEKIKKTKQLAKQIIARLNKSFGYDLPDNAECIDLILWKTDHATYELRETDEKHVRYVSVFNNRFSRGDINVIQVCKL